MDDDLLLLRALGRLLKRRCLVRTAATLEDAVAEVRRRPPDVLVSDFDLPPWTGEALLQMVALLYPTVRRILYSGASEVVLGDMVRRGLADVSLQKGCPINDVLRAIGCDALPH